MHFGKWKIWNDDGEPIPTGKVQVQYRGDTRIQAQTRVPDVPDAKFWKDECDDSDIIAYREVIEPEVRTGKCWAYHYKGVSLFFCENQINDDVVLGTYTATIDPETDKPTRIVWEADK